MAPSSGIDSAAATSAAGTMAHDQASEWAALAEAAVERHDYDTRARAREMLAATLAGIGTFHHGEIKPGTG